MNALLFLTGKVVLNSFKRALQSPKRLIGAILITAYWFLIFSGNIFGRGSNRDMEVSMPGQFSLPAEDRIFALMFAFAMVIFIFWALRMFKPPGFFRPADVDVLFPAPLKPKYVLLHRFAVDYLISLIIPILLLIFGGRGTTRGYEMLFRDLPNPEAATYIGKAMVGSFLLISLFGISFSYAFGLLINRDSEFSRLARKVALCVVIFLLAIITLLFIQAFYTEYPLQTLVSYSRNAFVNIIFFPAAAGAELAISPLYANLTKAFSSIAILALGIIGLLWLAVRQANYLYDMSAHSVASSTPRSEFQKTGDYTAIYTDMAMKGKIKTGKPPFVAEWKAIGIWSILWREWHLQWRTSMFFVILFLVLPLITSVYLLLFIENSQKIHVTVLSIVLLFLALMAFSLGQIGFIETLRKVDVQKPLPFSADDICMMEIISKASIPITNSLFFITISFVFAPSMWQYLLGFLIGIPFMLVLITSVQLLFLLIFPDIDDPTQRGLRSIVQLLATAISLLPPFLIALLLVFFKTPPPIIGTAFAIICAVITVILIKFAGSMYAAFNPSD